MNGARVSEDGIGEDMAKSAAATAVQLFLGAPAKVVSDFVGGAIGDRVEVWRKSRPAWQKLNAFETSERANEILRNRGAKIDPEKIRPEQVEAILGVAKDISSKELKDIFAHLLAAAVDPGRQKYYRSDFPEIAAKLEPLDALVLKELNGNGVAGPLWLNKITDKHRLERDEVEVAGFNLEKLGLVQKAENIVSVAASAFPSARGRQFLMCISD